MADQGEPDIIFKWTSSCRLCLANDTALDIFTSEKSSSIISNLQLLLNCLVYRGDPMPRKICPECLAKLSEFSVFRESCLKTEQELKRRLTPYCKIDHVQEYFDRCAKHNNVGTLTVSSTSVNSPDMTNTVKETVDSSEGSNIHENHCTTEQNLFEKDYNGLHTFERESSEVQDDNRSDSQGYQYSLGEQLPSDTFIDNSESCVLQQPVHCSTVNPIEADTVINSQDNSCSNNAESMEIDPSTFIPEHTASQVSSVYSLNLLNETTLIESETGEMETSLNDVCDGISREDVNDSPIQFESKDSESVVDIVGTIISVTGSASDLWGYAGSSSELINDISDTGTVTEKSSCSPSNNDDVFNELENEMDNDMMISKEHNIETDTNEIVTNDSIEFSESYDHTFTNSKDEVSSEFEMQRVPIAAIKQENGTVMCSKCHISLLDVFAFEHHECKLNENKTACFKCHKLLNHIELKDHKCVLESTILHMEAPQKEKTSQENVIEKRQLRSRVPKVMKEDEKGNSQLTGSVAKNNVKINKIIKKIMSKATLEKHFKLTPWKCALCQQYFNSKVKLLQHYNSQDCIQSTSTTYKCDFCLQYFLTYRELLHHQLVHIKVLIKLTDDDLLQCETCCSQFADEVRLQQHSIVHYMKHMSTVDIRYPCVECGEVYLQKDMFGNHLKSHSGSFQPHTTLTHPYKRRNIAIKSTTPHPNKKPETLTKSSTTIVKPPPIKTEIIKPELFGKTQCDYCDNIFENSLLLAKHLTFVHRIKNLKCESCGKIFFDRNSFEEHNKTHSSSKRCRMCGHIFATAEDLKQHELKKHKNPTPFSCWKCSLRFSTRSLLLIHHRVHLTKIEDDTLPVKKEDWESSDVEKSNSTVCSPPVTSSELESSDKKVSEDSDVPSVRYKCPLCPKVSYTAYQITVHITYKHSGKTAFPLPLTQPLVKRKVPKLKKKSQPLNNLKCSHCSKVFLSRKYLRCHLRKIHKLVIPDLRKSPHSIQHIQSTGSTSSDASLQLPDSHKDVIKSCPFCPQKVTMLTQHIKKYHKGERVDPNLLGVKIHADRNLVCRYCFKVCSSSHNRRVHESIHSNAKMQWFRCEKCNKKFFSKTVYEYHKKRVHVAESFHCEKCNKIFFKETFLYQHLCPKDDIADRKTFKCLQCPKSYDAMKGLKTHITVAHVNKSPKKSSATTSHVSPTVKKKSASVSKRDMLREVWREESNKIVCKVDDKFYCTLCDIEITTTEQLQDHQRVHPRGNCYVTQLGDTSFQCTICFKIFDSRKGGLLHIKHHKKSFDDNIPVVTSPVHKTTLGTKRNFKCPFCNIKYLTEANLENHIFYVHPEISKSTLTTPSRKIRISDSEFTEECSKDI